MTPLMKMIRKNPKIKTEFWNVQSAATIVLRVRTRNHALSAKKISD